MDSPILQVQSGFFVGWGTLALINAGLAQGKNRSGLNWFLLSLLPGPVATFILVAFCDALGEPTVDSWVKDIRKLRKRERDGPS